MCKICYMLSLNMSISYGNLDAYEYTRAVRSEHVVNRHLIVNEND